MPKGRQVFLCVLLAAVTFVVYWSVTGYGFVDFDDHEYVTANPQVQAGFNADISITPPRTAIVLPVGIGVEYYINPRFSLTAETNFRYTFTDYLDGFSRGANPSKKDFYQ